jgi:hypothetical protein
MAARPKLVGAIYLAVALLALANSGCLAVAVGCAAGGAGFAATAYCKGKVCQVYVADLPDALAATKAALVELGMVVEKEKDCADRIVLRSRTGDGDRVHINLCRQPSRIPAEGPITQICVRVATFGDRPLSGRILYQISAHLVAPAAPPPPVAMPVPPPGPPPTWSSAPTSRSANSFGLPRPQSPPPLQAPQPATMPPLAPPPRPVEPPLAR